MADEPATGLPSPLEPLWSSAPAGDRRGTPMPEPLRRAYGGELTLPLRPRSPTLVANFVSTVDGVVALDREQRSGGGEISGFDAHDRFVMGLLRSLADAVLVAAGTVRAAPTHEWTPRRVFRAAAGEFAAWRQALGLAPQPTTVIVTGSGRLDPDHPALNAPDVPIVVATTDAGAARLAGAGLAPHVRVEALGPQAPLPPAATAALLRRLGARIVVCEGGPSLFAGLLEAGLVDELFLTLAPQVAGRTPRDARLALVEGAAFAPDRPLWLELRSVRRGASHLFLSYAAPQGPRDGPVPGDGGGAAGAQGAAG